MSEILKPCPFCGCTDNFITVTSNPFSNDIYSTTHCKCYATGPFIAENYLTGEKVPTREFMEKKATERWNTRPIEDALHARIAELEAEIDQLTVHGDIERQDDKWIPVSERLPEDLQSIIVFTKDRKTYIIRFLELYGREGFGSLSDIVTHWMPLPVLPESPNDTQTQTVVYRKESEE